MGCEQCGASEAEPIQVRYAGDRTTTVSLCEDCFTAFRTGDLVQKVIPEDPF